MDFIPKQFCLRREPHTIWVFQIQSSYSIYAFSSEGFFQPRAGQMSCHAATNCTLSQQEILAPTATSDRQCSLLSASLTSSSTYPLTIIVVIVVSCSVAIILVISIAVYIIARRRTAMRSLDDSQTRTSAGTVGPNDDSLHPNPLRDAWSGDYGNTLYIFRCSFLFHLSASTYYYLFTWGSGGCFFHKINYNRLPPLPSNFT